MKIDRALPYYLLLLLFPVSFLLHNINENWSLIGLPDSLYLLLIYLLTTVAVAVVSKKLLSRYPHAFVFSFFLLVINFLFGAFKDVAKEHHWPALITSYKFLLPALFLLLVVVGIVLNKTAHSLHRLALALGVFLSVNCAYEAGWSLYNLITSRDVRQDFGDYHHKLIQQAPTGTTAGKPDVYWLVFDEYAGSASLRKVWGFRNPLDSMLRADGFFVADSAYSNYNFTHYSFSSTLDMVYLPELQAHTRVTLKDLQRGNFSVWENNTLQLFEQLGYSINNSTIFQFRDHPTSSFEMFRYVPRLLINFQTFEGRVRGDIGWNFPNMLKKNRRIADSANISGLLKSLDTAYKHQVTRFLTTAAREASSPRPSFNMFHLQLPHEPYFYRADGSIAFQNGFSDSAKHYPAHLQYTSRVVKKMADSIRAMYRGKEVVIIIQGDHGFKYQEQEAFYDLFSCNILYAVFCSDGDYRAWPRNITSVNGFRILFNKYFHTGFPMLPNRSYNLYYR